MNTEIQTNDIGPVFTRRAMVDPETCDRLRCFADAHLADDPGPGIASLKFDQISALDPDGHGLKRVMNSFRYSAIHQVRGHFDGVGRCLPSTTLLTRWPTGCGLAPHCDTDTWWRSFTAICYLNGDFTGGELVFTATGQTLIPEPGLFVAFRSDDREARHLVRPVASGVRYTLSCFLTGQIERAEL